MDDNFDPFDDEQVEQLTTQMDEMIARREAQTRAVMAVDYIAERAVERWTKGDLQFFICEMSAWKELQMVAAQHITSDHTTDVGQWCGYVRFPKLPGILPGYNGIYAYVPVHGGITFFQEWANGSVTYGFDCAHSHSGDCPIDDISWMKLEAESMARGIQIAARFERYYLKAGDSNEKKLRVLERMEKFLPLEIGGNIGAMLNILKGEL